MTGKKLYAFHFDRERANALVNKIQDLEVISNKLLDVAISEGGDIIKYHEKTDNTDLDQLNHYIKIKDSFAKTASIMTKLEQYIGIKRGILPKDMGEKNQPNAIDQARRLVEMIESKAK